MSYKIGLATFAVAAAVTAAFALGGGARITKVNGTAWRASFADAQAEAKRTGKPILLLSMFGKLDEEMPCANARTLRATLFKDPEFKAFVEKEAIPAWEMVRPVPHVTIDFGDGKKVVRTVRGNAVMYLVNPDGKVFDAFPGVYTKEDFLPAARESIAQLGKAGASEVVAFHEARAKPVRAAFLTMSKGMAESPTLNLIGARPIAGARTAPKPNDDPAQKRFLNQAARLSYLSLTPMSAEDTVVRLTGAPLGNRDPKTLALDIIRADSKGNMERARPVVHYYFAAQKNLPTPAEARDAVLGTILKIPYKDPTMGLSDVLVPGTPE